MLNDTSVKAPLEQILLQRAVSVFVVIHWELYFVAFNITANKLFYSEASQEHFCYERSWAVSEIKLSL